MPKNTTHYLNNIKINPPFNGPELELELNFDKDSETAIVQASINKWRLVRENAAIIKAWNDAGLTGGVGILEGIPYRIEAESGGIREILYNGYIDQTDDHDLSCEDVTVSVKERESIDWLNDIADSKTMQYMAEVEGLITSANYVLVPYVVSSIPDYTNSAMCMVAIFVLSTELKQAIKDLALLLGESANPFEATALIRAALFVIYLIALVITIVKLVKDFLSAIIQPVKYHYGMRAKDTFVIGCESFDLEFRSSIFENAEMAKMVIIPAKYSLPTSGDFDIMGIFSPQTDQIGYYKGTFGQYCRDMETMLGGKIIIQDKVLYFEKQSYNPSAATYKIPSVENPFYKYNTDEFISNFFVSFATDLVEKNTIQDYTGTSYQVMIRPNVINNADLVLAKGLKQINIPFALAKRKTALTTPEKIVKGFMDVFSFIINALISAVNVIIDVYNKVAEFINDIIDAVDTYLFIDIDIRLDPIKELDKIDLGASIANRIGTMKMDSDFMTTPKVLLLQEAKNYKNNKLAPLNEIILSAKFIWNTFLKDQSFVPTTERPNGNQWRIPNEVIVPFTLEDYQKIKANNKVLDPLGKEAEIIGLKYVPADDIAKIRYRVNELYTSNLKEVTYEPTGR